MKVRGKWVLIGFCVLMVASALFSAWRRQLSVPEPQPRDPAPVSWFAPRQRPPSEYNFARELNHAVADAVEKVMPSVVVVSTTARTRYLKKPLDPFGIYYQIVPDELTGEGSGVIIDERGYVLTSWHVIDGEVEHIEVVLADGTPLDAEEVGHDKATDLAVLRIIGDHPSLTAVEFGDSDGVRIGDMVIAIGSPFNLQSTVTIGHVSQKGRRMQVLPYEDFIQTDVAINEGNSGGPLVDVDGRLIGINAAILTEAQQKGIGIAFSVPSNLSMVIAKSLIERGMHEWPWVGAIFSRSKDQSDKQLYVANVWRDTPAARAGMQAGDVVLAVNGKPMGNEYDVYRVIFNHSVGETVNFLIAREGEKQPEIELLLEEFPGLPY